MLDFSRVRTPADNGEVLILPEPKKLGDLLRQNRRQADAWEVRILDRDARELRHETFLSLARDARQPLVLTGHQPDFIHPGVWAKHAVTRLLAEQVNGAAINLVVDQDAPKDELLPIPVDGPTGAEIVQVPCADAVHGTPFELIPAMTPQALDEFGDRVRAAMGPGFETSLMPLFLTGCADKSSERRNLVLQMLAGRRVIDRELDVEVEDRCVSRAWPAWHAAELILNAEEFAQAYNESLAEYRRAQGIKTASRPIPDLQQRSGRIELPLWAYGPKGLRRRVWAERDGDVIHLFAESIRLGTLPTRGLSRSDQTKDLLTGKLSAPLRPRALVLTLWARMFACDLFVHGIGGAAYDRITDGIIARYYEVNPPAYACVSATLRLPIREHATTARDLRAAQVRARDVIHNPQRYVSPHPERSRIESELTEALAKSRELRSRDPRQRAARRELFVRQRELKAALRELEPGLRDRLTEDVNRIEAQLAHNLIARGREYFVGLYPRDRVRILADEIRRQMRQAAVFHRGAGLI